MGSGDSMGPWPLAGHGWSCYRPAHPRPDFCRPRLPELPCRALGCGVPSRPPCQAEEICVSLCECLRLSWRNDTIVTSEGTTSGFQRLSSLSVALVLTGLLGPWPHARALLSTLFQRRGPADPPPKTLAC